MVSTHKGWDKSAGQGFLVPTLERGNEKNGPTLMHVNKIQGLKKLAESVLKHSQ